MIELEDGYARAFVESLRVRSEHTAKSYAFCIDRFLKAVDKPVAEVTITDAARYLATLDGLSPASKAHHISATRSFLKFLQSQGVIAASTLDVLRRPRVAITSMTRYLTETEAEKLIAASADVSWPCYLSVAALMLTGLRVSELAQAQWRHLFRDPEGRLGLLVVGKGGKERVVKVRGDLFELLCEQRTRMGLAAVLDGKDKTPLLANRKGEAYHTRSLHKLVAKAAVKADLKKDVSPHWLRHSFATLAALGGAPAFQLQQDLGHSRLETSQRYVHWAVGLRDSAVDKLPSTLIRNTH